jgi:hypothetical protein
MKIKFYKIFILIILLSFCSTPIIKQERNSSFYRIEHYKTKRTPKGILLQFDPISFSIDTLEKHWIPFWLKENYEVVQIIQNEKRFLSSQEVDVILKDIQENNSLSSKKIILTGISLGGITILDYLNEKENIEGISRVVVIGTGWDYAYSGNLFYENHDLLNKKIKDIKNFKFLSYKKYLEENYNKPFIEDFFIPNVSIEKKKVKYLGNHRLPMLIVVGKIDPFSPEDSMIPFIKNYQQCSFKTLLNQCYYIEASRANFFDKDYNHFDLFLYDDVIDDLYQDMNEWIRKEF